MKHATLTLLYVCVVILLKNVHADTSAPQTGVAPDGAGLRYATEVVVRDAGEESPNTPQAGGTAVACPRSILFEDMAFLSTSTVTVNSAGIMVKNRNGQAVSVAVHDAKGRQQLTKSYASSTPVINVGTSQLTAGAYVYTVQVGDSIFTHPFIVTRR